MDDDAFGRALHQVTLGGVGGFLISCFAGVGFTIGASAAVCALIGAMLALYLSTTAPVERSAITLASLMPASLSRADGSSRPQRMAWRVARAPMT